VVEDVVGLGEPCSQWLIDVHHVGLLIPAVVVIFHLTLAELSERCVLPVVGPVFCVECKHRGAAGTTLEPDDEWVRRGLAA